MAVAQFITIVVGTAFAALGNNIFLLNGFPEADFGVDG